MEKEKQVVNGPIRLVEMIDQPYKASNACVGLFRLGCVVYDCDTA